MGIEQYEHEGMQSEMHEAGMETEQHEFLDIQRSDLNDLKQSMVEQKESSDTIAMQTYMDEEFAYIEPDGSISQDEWDKLQQTFEPKEGKYDFVA